MPAYPSHGHHPSHPHHATAPTTIAPPRTSKPFILFMHNPAYNPDGSPNHSFAAAHVFNAMPDATKAMFVVHNIDKDGTPPGVSGLQLYESKTNQISPPGAAAVVTLLAMMRQIGVAINMETLHPSAVQYTRAAPPKMLPFGSPFASAAAASASAAGADVLGPAGAPSTFAPMVMKIDADAKNPYSPDVVADAGTSGFLEGASVPGSHFDDFADVNVFGGQDGLAPSATGVAGLGEYQNFGDIKPEDLGQGKKLSDDDLAKINATHTQHRQHLIATVNPKNAPKPKAAEAAPAPPK